MCALRQPSREPKRKLVFTGLRRSDPPGLAANTPPGQVLIHDSTDAPAVSTPNTEVAQDPCERHTDGLHPQACPERSFMGHSRDVKGLRSYVRNDPAFQMRDESDASCVQKPCCTAFSLSGTVDVCDGGVRR